MHISTKTIFGFIIFFSSLSLFAAEACPNTHTWHTIFATDGEWKANLQMINEQEHAWFVAPNCEKVNSFSVSQKSPQKYGFGFDSQADFDVAYTVTLTQQSSAKRFTSKACVFLVTAKGPAQPDITIKSYNGAQCNWFVVPGVGEDFYVG